MWTPTRALDASARLRFEHAPRLVLDSRQARTHDARTDTSRSLRADWQQDAAAARRGALLWAPPWAPRRRLLLRRAPQPEPQATPACARRTGVRKCARPAFALRPWSPAPFRRSPPLHLSPRAAA